jgi:hypothetical protein
VSLITLATLLVSVANIFKKDLIKLIINYLVWRNASNHGDHDLLVEDEEMAESTLPTLDCCLFE